jgi:hypothetical protein
MFDTILSMYKQLKIGDNEICKMCKSNNTIRGLELSNPISIFQVGNNFLNDGYKVLFVGKNARGTLYDLAGKIPDIIDSRDAGRNYFLCWKRNHFWSYTKSIAQQLAHRSPEEAFDSIAITNLVKCNNAMYMEGQNPDGTYRDCTTTAMKNNCLNNLKVFWRELEILSPKHVVFYTHHDYDAYIQDFPGIDSVNEICDKEHVRANGGKDILWWDRELYKDGKLVMRVLRTSHPERQNKEGFVEKIVSWILHKI